MGDFFRVMGFLVFLAASVVGGSYAAWYAFDYYSPKYEESRRKTFEQSRAFNEGMVRDLQNLRMDYLKADANGKAALRATIIHRFSVYDKNTLPAELRLFYSQLELGQ